MEEKELEAFERLLDRHVHSLPMIKEIHEAIQRVADEDLTLSDEQKTWLVDVPEYHSAVVDIERFTIDAHTAFGDGLNELLAAVVGNRAILQGTYTRLKVNGVLWMSDTPAEMNDHRKVDNMLKVYGGFPESSALIVGLGLGMVVNRAIYHKVKHIDVVEENGWVIDAVGSHYRKKAKDAGLILRIHHDNIHKWKVPQDAFWQVGWFDIWADINDLDLPEVARLRRRFKGKLAWFGAWAQWERQQMKKTIREAKKAGYFKGRDVGV